jgi:hypothetical protein
MFTALVLMCATEMTKTPEQCVVMTSNLFFESKVECEADIYRVVADGTLIAVYPDKKPVDYYCVNWSALKA